MPCIPVREGDGVVSVINLDGCGTPEPGDLGLLQTTSIIEIGWEDSITEGDTVRRTNFGGRVCYTDAGCDTLDYTTVNMTSCGLNPALESMLTGAALKLAGEAVRGYARRDLGCYQNVAIEILMQLDQDSCDGSGGDAPVLGWLFPLVKNWRPGGASTLNGADPLEPQFTGKAYKNPLIFGTEESPVVVAPLAKWQDAEFDAANDWYQVYIFDAEDAPLPEAPSCDPVELALAAS